MTETVINTAASAQQLFYADRANAPADRSISTSANNPSDIQALRSSDRKAPTAVVRQGGNEAAQQRQAKPRRDDVAAQAAAKRTVQAEAKPAPKPDIKVETQRKPRAPEPEVKIEVKDFDIGRSASEIVGTIDVVQRFDNNADGRVDSLEGQRAQRARSESSTYRALAATRIDAAPVVDQVQRQAIAEASTDAPVAPSPAPEFETPDARTNERAEAVPKKLFSGADSSPVDGNVPSVQPKKLFDDADAVASQGVFADGVAVERKFYGEGVEVVRGRFADDPEVQKKFYDEAAAQTRGRFAEDGTGEEKLYDKVAQSESGRFYDAETQKKLYDGEEIPTVAQGDGDPEAEATLYEKAQEVKAARDTVDSDVQPKKLYGELELYSDVAGYESEEVEVSPTKTIVTA